jgi:DNA-binding beta-propeller fold protein YncE
LIRCRHGAVGQRRIDTIGVEAIDAVPEVGQAQVDLGDVVPDRASPRFGDESVYIIRMARGASRLVTITALLAALAGAAPALGDCAQTLGEVSAPGASVPFEISRQPDGSLVLEFEDNGADGFNLYRGHIGSFYDHDASFTNVCSIITTTPEPGRARAVLPADSEGNDYFLVTAIYAAGEGTAGFDSRGDEIPVVKNVCLPDELTRDLVLTNIGEYLSGANFNDGGAEIVKARSYFDNGSDHLEAWITNGDAESLDVVDLDDPFNPVLAKRIVLDSVATSGPSSVAIDPLGRGVAVSLPDPDDQDPGWVQLLSFEGDVLYTVLVGALPDMLTFTPDGSTIVVANEGEPSNRYNPAQHPNDDPAGTVTLLEVGTGPMFGNPAATTIGFSAVPTVGDVRHFGPSAASPELDYEPEHVVVEPSGEVAWVVLQENNAIAKLDLVTKAFVEVRGLGTHDHNVGAGGLDPSDQNGIAIGSYPVSGFYQPDGAAYLEVRGRSLLVTSNEGETRDYSGFSEEVRVEQLNLDTPLADFLVVHPEFGRLEVTTTRGDSDMNGSFEALFSFGTRSISIFDPRDSLDPVWNSGSDLEYYTSQALPAWFNSDNNENNFDDRSRKRGPEPEGIVVGSVCGRKYAFVGLERVSGVAVFAVGDPENSIFAGYFTSRDFTADIEETDETGGVGPEGLAFVSASDSPTGAPLLLVANEVSGTLDVWEIVPAYP